MEGGKQRSLECWQSSPFLIRVLVTQYEVCENSASLPVHVYFT